MEFKFRAGDQQPPPTKYSSPRPAAIYSKQGISDACLRRSTNSLITLRKPFDSNDAMQCEMELMRLREEKLLVEIERQRFLKEEARRELMLLEREIAIRGLAQSVGYSFRDQHHRLGTPFSAAALTSQMAVMQQQPRSSDRLVFGAVVLPPRGQPFMAEEKKEVQVLQADKREVIVLEKPDPNVFREKRKAETSSTLTSTSTVDIQPFCVKKNPKDDWSCALCQVTVPSEKTFNQHLQGKKHKRKEAALIAQNASNSNVSPAAPESLPNKRRKLLEVTETFGSSAGAEKKESKVDQCEKTECSFDLKLDGKEDKQQNELVIEQNLMTGDVFVGKKKFKLWCEKCKVGAYTSDVMFAHLNGKKHQASLQEGQPL